MRVKYSVLSRTYNLHREEYQAAALRALNSGWYILGKEMLEFEKRFASYFGVKHCIAVNSGTDALILAFRALGIGKNDEVICPANTYIASVIGVTENGGTPVFVDIDPYLGIDADAIEAKITDKTKAILPVHLYGQSSQMDKIVQIAEKYNLYIVEDCAQCHGSKFNGQLTGTFSTIGCFSFYPTKPLGAMGDAGAMVTNDDLLAERLRMIRNYGSHIKYHFEISGINSRMDEIQAAILQVALKHMDEGNSERIRIAKRYLAEINNPLIQFQKKRPDALHVYHLFPVFVKDRDPFIKFLEENGIGTQIHYPIPPYVSECYSYMGYSWDDYPLASESAKTEVSLPIYAGMPEDDIDEVISVINRYKL